MKHFDVLPTDLLDNIFYMKPSNFNKYTKKNELAYALGATMYTPSTRLEIARDIVTNKHRGLTSLVLCLEDSISDLDVEFAEDNLVSQLSVVHQEITNGLIEMDNIPLIFVRVRSANQMERVVSNLGRASDMLCGFVFPKFSIDNGEQYLSTLSKLNEQTEHIFYGMPILETEDVIYKENRASTLARIKELLDSYYDFILNVRIGATDLCGLYGIRRGKDTTIYDVAIIRDCISDILNVFGRSDKEYVISGVVWEYFVGGERILKPQLRQTPFQQAFGRSGLELRKDILNRFEDSLIHEILLDKTNGIVGKTIIHPTHILPVQAMNVVSYEEYMDALAIIESAESFNGVIRSEFRNKMNEVKPHYNWARKILIKSKIYGVFHEQQSFIDLLNTNE